MLFNSYEFIFLFLPVTIILFYSLGGLGCHKASIVLLTSASLFFYGWWNTSYLLLIIGSIIFNYTVGSNLGADGAKRFFNHPIQQKTILVFGISGNLMLLGYFKYANFFVENINSLFGSNFHLEKIFLPLAISFFTFQQITFLVDSYRSQTKDYDFIQYCLFVTFFPQLIAGPIVHHNEMMPQFIKEAKYKFKHENLSVGLTIFIIGLFKKVIFADGIAVYSTPVFNAAGQSETLSFFEAWVGTFAYTFQIYFDFSGYSDMAIGLGRIFGVILPLNFFSPYKAKNIIEFWKHWHMTLTRFITAYLFTPIALSLKRKSIKYKLKPSHDFLFTFVLSILIAYTLSGLWHGAGWTFVIWGILNGTYLVINHVFHAFRRALGHDLSQTTILGCCVSRLITFLVVAVTMVIFRSESLEEAMEMYAGMTGINGFKLPLHYLPYLNSVFGLGDLLQSYGFQFSDMNFFPGWEGWSMLTFLLLVVWVMPNTLQLMADHKPALNMHDIEEKSRISVWPKWKPSILNAIIVCVLFFLCLSKLNDATEFLYFQF